jgi:hypothetical protein
MIFVSIFTMLVSARFPLVSLRYQGKRLLCFLFVSSPFLGQPSFPVSCLWVRNAKPNGFAHLLDRITLESFLIAGRITGRAGAIGMPRSLGCHSQRESHLLCGLSGLMTERSFFCRGRGWLPHTPTGRCWHTAPTAIVAARQCPTRSFPEFNL